MMAKKISNVPSILFMMAKKKKMMFMADTIMEKMTDFSLPVPQTERPIIKVFRNLWYSIVDYRVPKMFS